MLGWKYRLSIKELWQDREDDDDDQARDVAPEVAKRIRALAARVAAKSLRLSAELDEIAERFECVPEVEAPAHYFNGALTDLYNAGDDYRISVS
ncbi:hypothetical protein [Methylobacterium bullatum]